MDDQKGDAAERLTGRWIETERTGQVIDGLFKSAERLLVIGVVQYAALSLDSEILWGLTFVLFLAYFAWLWRGLSAALRALQRRTIALGRVATLVLLMATACLGVAAGLLLDDVVTDLARLNQADRGG